MPGPKPLDDEKIAEAVRQGRLSTETLDIAVRRLLELIQWLPEKKTVKAAGFEEHHKLAVRVAEEGIVMLKNDGVLPWNAKSIRSVAIIGESAKASNHLKGGSAYIIPTKMEEPLETLKEYLKDTAEVRYAPGYDASDALIIPLVKEAAAAAAACDCALIVARTGMSDYSEGIERKHLSLPEQQIRLIEQVTKAQPNTVVAVICGSAFETYRWEKNAGAVLSYGTAGRASAKRLRTYCSV
jgi:beta-glucosidase